MKKHIIQILQNLSIVTLCIVVVGCKASNRRYHLKDDRHPIKKINYKKIMQVKNPVPRIEPISKIGNPKSYKVFNKKYHVLKNSHGYEEIGYASWYGEKFHGYHTSNGEIYDMYAMSAAHKHLPLPTYLKVINLENGKHVIVRVNDRGPFHGNRIIDLSYTAAYKLGITKKGTAKVKIIALSKPKKEKYHIILAANVESYQRIQEQLNDILPASFIKINDTKEQYEIKIGPFNKLENTKEIMATLVLNSHSPTVVGN